MTADEPTTVVVVDASPDLRWVLRRVFQRKGGFDVVGDTDDAAYGLDLVRNLQPDLVLLDVDDPRLDAADAVRGIRLSCPDTMVIATMSMGRGAARDAVVDAGAGGVIRKDVTLQHTFDQLWSVLAAPRQGRFDARLQTEVATLDHA